MKLRVRAMGAAVLVLVCSSSVASAQEAVRPSKPAGTAKSRLHVTRISPRLQHANQDGSTIPIVIAGVTAAGAATYFATKEDKPASR